MAEQAHMNNYNHDMPNLKAEYAHHVEAPAHCSKTPEEQVKDLIDQMQNLGDAARETEERKQKAAENRERSNAVRQNGTGNQAIEEPERRRGGRGR